jgi:formylglycine-generating enzyme required for sulfatase activity
MSSKPEQQHMKTGFFCAMVMGFFTASSSVLAQSSMLRVGCEGDDMGAEVSVNDKFRGECPLDIQVSEGPLKLRLVKKVDALHERVFEQDIRMGDGTVKRVDARLGASQLTAEGRQQEAQRAEAARQHEEARLREIEQAEQQKQKQQQETLARLLAEFKAQGIVAGTGNTFRDCSDCPEMVWIPPGNLPQRVAGANRMVAWLNQVSIAYPLAIGKYELTHDEWERCVAENGCRNAVEGRTYGYVFTSYWGRGRQPVVHITLHDVNRYMTWLSKKTGREYRLLSQAEFIYAARAGRSTNLPGGDEIGRNNANCRNCGSATGGERPAPVGSFAANGWGLHDMVGNVAEMTLDCPSDLGKAPKDGSPVTTGCVISFPNRGADFIAAGGSWDSEISGGLPVETYFADSPGLSVGLRVARTFKLSPADSVEKTK